MTDHVLNFTDVVAKLHIYTPQKWEWFLVTLECLLPEEQQQ